MCAFCILLFWTINYIEYKNGSTATGGALLILCTTSSVYIQNYWIELWGAGRGRGRGRVIIVLFQAEVTVNYEVNYIFPRRWGA